jgi:hypothetical protein
MKVLGIEITSETRRDTLLKLIERLATLEPHFTDKEIAQARCIGVNKVREHMLSGLIRDAKKDGASNPWTAPLSAIAEYDRQTAIKLQRSKFSSRIDRLRNSGVLTHK